MSVSNVPVSSNMPRRHRTRRMSRIAIKTNFEKIGGLNQHITLLKEIVIMPLLHADLYNHFNIKPPRGVIFYGPPGTGKTLVAGALATEISKQAGDRVVFYHRKGADVLDKWVGESERKLRELFDKARRTRPSLIFFDELDGLAPERSSRNDQVHASVVTTLLALMDGLEDSSGVVVIGATNRIECVDPALRRPGRFDRELYFPLPNGEARKEILTVHTQTWRHKPSPELLEKLSHSTCGCCGSDLQAICAEAVLCCVKRNYPQISERQTSTLDLNTLIVTEDDFNQARGTISPCSHRFGGCKLRKLTPFIQPLLQRQVDKVVGHIEVLLPHFLDQTKKYVMGSERYAGRLLLKGSSQQGLNNYVIPAILQRFEHLQASVLDMPQNYARVLNNVFQSAPSILVLSRVDDWWDLLETAGQMSMMAMLENIHAGLPVLVIVTFDTNLPTSLHAHFVYNSSIFIEMDNPTTEERRAFFSPLFFGKTCMSLSLVLHGGITASTKREADENESTILPCIPPIKGRAPLQNKNCFRFASGCVCKRLIQNGRRGPGRRRPNCASRNQSNQHVAVLLQSMWNRTAGANGNNIKSTVSSPEKSKTEVREEIDKTCSMVTNLKSVKQINNSKLTDEQKIQKLWYRTAHSSTVDLPVVHLELLYDALLACISINTNNFEEAFIGLETTLSSFEKI